MKKLTLAAVIAVSLSQTACANNGWVAPALIGGVVGYAIARPAYYGAPPQYSYPSSQPAYVCPQGLTPTYQQQIRYDNYGRPFTVNIYQGCR